MAYITHCTFVQPPLLPRTARPPRPLPTREFLHLARDFVHFSAGVPEREHTSGKCADEPEPAAERREKATDRD